MKLLRLELENFRQYRDQVTFNFSLDDEKNMNIIQGVNGAGKTNLLNALTWCLYGTEENLSKYAGKKLPIANEAALRELDTNKALETRVQVVMVNSSGETTIFERKLLTRKDQNGHPLPSQNSDFHAYQQRNGDMRESTLDKNFLVNRILPKGVKGFFFFDGERLDEFFKEENSTKVKEAILDVSQLSLLDKSINHLEKTISSIRGDLRYQGSTQVSEITTSIADHEKKRDSLRQEKKKRDVDLGKLNEEISKIDEILETHSLPIVKELQSQRIILDGQLSQLEAQGENLKKDINENLLESGPSIYTIDALRFSLNEIQSITKKGELPPKMKDTFVKELLETGMCICGCDISHESPERQKVPSFLNEAKISQIHDDLTELKYQINPITKQVGDFISTQNQFRTKMSEIDSKITEAKTKLKDVSD